MERLNKDFYIQLPESYTGAGFEDQCFEMSNPEGDLVINQCDCGKFNLLAYHCVGDVLDQPFPDSIGKLPSMVSSTFLNFNQVDHVFDQWAGQTGILYSTTGHPYADQEPVMADALYYQKCNGDFISMLWITFNLQKKDSVIMICATLNHE